MTSTSIATQISTHSSDEYHRTVNPSGVNRAPPPENKDAKGNVTTHLLIDGKWYDMTYWKHTHPGGALMLERMNGNDSTDAFYSLHSRDAAARLTRFPSSATPPAHLKNHLPAPSTKATVAFRSFRDDLEKKGYFDRVWYWELFYTLSVYVMGVVGSYLAYTGSWFAASVVLGLGMQQAGWIAHDFIHARGHKSYWNALVMQCMNGFSREWWSFKHNTHHVFTNYIGFDTDIQNDPVFFLFFPDPKDDTPFRRMQHWYYVPVASLLYFSWRMQSIQVSWARKDWKELIPQLISYIWLYTLGWKVALLSVYIGGGLVAMIVTATHQSEEFLDSQEVGTMYSYVEGQFTTTRDARMTNFFMEWLWGGMQYQLEHHLFPTMPKYHFNAVRPLVEKFAKENGLDYRCDPSEGHVWKRNWLTLKYFSGPKDAENCQLGKHE